MSIHQLQLDAPIKAFSGHLLPRVDAQLHETCASFEMRMADCLEAYGYINGQKKCRDFIADMQECIINGKQKQRVQKMREERHRQFKNGERKECYLKTPEYDAY
ncbi:NADH dehydrogenase [ubiquinone] iron-sulfur protein 5 [Trichogramma pretiosum]|uniref:Complex I-15 kDa n=1 Tax=Trichogramma kaykai TaxID=54128 RepID=A0ABD2WRT4_9HYME|nr:NADH dehydrogenase [ubiquinone] iron-sulfur protein 5 [Trichogramma pretiosum]XP_014225062.1 NADH dehydrogenase [ubiquinone] iron-sulfur protein 5 [Trichogramma pretiosum]